MPAHKIVSPSQMEVLLSFMAEHRNLATGRLNSDGQQGKQAAKKLWEELTSRINSVGVGIKRSADMWRRYWNERKYAVKKKAALAASHDRTIGGVPPRKLQLADEEIRILRLISKLAVLKEEPDIISNNENEAKEMSTTSLDPLEHLVIEEHLPTSVLQSQFPQPLKHSPPVSSASDDETVERRRRVRMDEPPRWAIDIEERRLAATERLAATVERLTAAVVGMQGSLHTLTTEVAAIRTALHSRLPP